MTRPCSISWSIDRACACAWLAASLIAHPHADAGQFFALTADDLMPGDNYGYAVGIDAGTVLIGARLNDTPGGVNAGSATLYDSATGGLLRTLTPDDAAANDFFGRSVAIAGDTVLIGASQNDDDGNDSGSAYLFDAGNGRQRYKLTASDASATDQFGYAVALNGAYAAIGSPWDDPGGANTGSVYVFDAGTGLEQIKLTADDAQPGDLLGFSLAIDTGFVLAGAQSDDAGTDSGSAYVFNAGTGEQLFKLTASDAATGDKFGNVALDGNTALIGAPQNDDDGSAYLFDITTGVELFKLTASDAGPGALFGASVAISGQTALVGAYGDNNQTGAIYGFDVLTGEELFKFTASDAGAGDAFGFAIALDGLSAVVGTPLSGRDADNAGAAYLFDLPPPPEPLLGDFNLDGFIGVDDLNFLLLNWSKHGEFNQPQPGDLTGDGFVGVDDLNWLLINWNTGTPPAVATVLIPEPGSVVWLSALGLGLLHRRRCLSGIVI